MSQAPVAGGWRRLALRCALVPAAVLAPLITLAPTGTHRYNVYWHGSAVRTNPWMLVTENLRTIGVYLDLGSFRPLGRILEWTLDLAAYLLVEFLRLPADIALRLITLLAAAVLTGAAVVFAEAVTARGAMFAALPSRPVALVPFAVAACLVAAGPTSATVLAGGYHFLVAALVLGVAARVCRSPLRAAPILVAGAALALVDEMAALTLPLATVAMLARARTRPSLDRPIPSPSGPSSSSPCPAGLPSPGFPPSCASPPSLPPAGPLSSPSSPGLSPASPSSPGLSPASPSSPSLPTPSPSSPGPSPAGLMRSGLGRLGFDRVGLLRLVRPVGLLWLGFLPVFVAGRLLIHASCAGTCPSVFSPSLLAGRLVAWLPPLQWGTATRSAAGPSPVVVMLAVLVFGLLGWRAIIELNRLPGLDRRQSIGLAAVGAALLALGAAWGTGRPGGATGSGWGLGGPESAVTAAGGALLIVGALACWNRLVVQQLALAGLTLLCAGSAAANQAYTGRANGAPAALVDNAIAAEIAQFDYSDAGDARRCGLRDRFATLMPAERLDLTLDMATVQMYGEPFCRRGL